MVLFCRRVYRCAVGRVDSYGNVVRIGVEMIALADWMWGDQLAWENEKRARIARWLSLDLERMERIPSPSLYASTCLSLNHHGWGV